MVKRAKSQSRLGPARPGRASKTAFGVWRLLLAICAACLAFPQAALAQLQYTNSLDGPVSETVTPCSNPLVRNFTVSEFYTVADVNIGVLMSHSYRGDLQFYLQSPIGTRVQLINNVGATRNNVNVLFDDAAASSISTHTSSNDTATAGTVVPAYQRNFRPFQALSAFNNQEANGTWRLEICDSLNADSGTFFQSDLFLTARPATVNVTKISTVLSDGVSLSNPKAIPGATVRYCITIANTGPGTAMTIAAADALPANTSFVAGSIRSGANCGTATTVEDDNAIGADESDPLGASFAAGSVSINAASMLGGASFAIAFNALVN